MVVRVRFTARTIRLSLVVVVCLWAISMLYISRRQGIFLHDIVTGKVASYIRNYIATSPQTSSNSNSNTASGGDVYKLLVETDTLLDDVRKRLAMHERKHTTDIAKSKSLPSESSLEDRMRVKQPLAVIAAASGPGNGSTTGVGAGQSGAHIGGSEEEVEVESEGGGGGGGKKYWLVIGIPTVSRLHDEDYLLTSLQTIAEQLSSNQGRPLQGRVLVHVVNMQAFKHMGSPHGAAPLRHVIFDEAKKRYASRTDSFRFSEVRATDLDDLTARCRHCVLDPKPGASESTDQGNANVPGYLVRRQTRSLAMVIRMNLDVADYYLFLEDDMRFCKNGFKAIKYLLDKATRYHGNWLAVRASYGMNGIFLPSADLETFAAYLVKHQVRRPPDHLVVEWFAGETPEAAGHKNGRANIGFKFNLFDHIGVVSTLRSQKTSAMPGCYDPLLEPTVFAVEAFSPAQCPRDDVWPCAVPHRDGPDQIVHWDRLL